MEVQFSPEETGSVPPQDQSTQTDPNRPAWLPPQFKTVEDFAKSYNELQAAHTRTSQELSALKKQPQAPDPADAGKPEDQKPADEGKPPQDDQANAAQQVAAQAGVDLDPYQEEYNTTGDVSEESRTKLAEGLSKVLGPNARQVVDDFIEARKVVIQNDQKMYMEAAGGQDQYSTMVEWAKSNWSAEQVAAYNRQVQSGDRHATLFAIEGLRSKYEAANGRIPQRISATGGADTSQGAFRSVAEMTRAMSDPRYQTDEAYREEVRQKLALSNF